MYTQQQQQQHTLLHVVNTTAQETQNITTTADSSGLSGNFSPAASSTTSGDSSVQHATYSLFSQPINTFVPSAIDLIPSSAGDALVREPINVMAPTPNNSFVTSPGHSVVPPSYPFAASSTNNDNFAGSCLPVTPSRGRPLAQPATCFFRPSPSSPLQAFAPSPVHSVLPPSNNTSLVSISSNHPHVLSPVHSIMTPSPNSYHESCSPNHPLYSPNRHVFAPVSPIRPVVAPFPIRPFVSPHQPFFAPGSPNRPVGPHTQPFFASYSPSMHLASLPGYFGSPPRAHRFDPPPFSPNHPFYSPSPPLVPSSTNKFTAPSNSPSVRRAISFSATADAVSFTPASTVSMAMSLSNSVITSANITEQVPTLDSQSIRASAVSMALSASSSGIGAQYIPVFGSQSMATINSALANKGYFQDDWVTGRAQLSSIPVANMSQTVRDSTVNVTLVNNRYLSHAASLANVSLADNENPNCMARSLSVNNLSTTSNSSVLNISTTSTTPAIQMSTTNSVPSLAGIATTIDSSGKNV